MKIDRRSFLMGTGVVLLAGVGLLGPGVADDLRHLGEIAGLAYPAAAGLMCILAGRRSIDRWRPGLLWGLAILFAGALVFMALDRVVFGAIISVPAAMLAQFRLSRLPAARR